MPEPVPVSDRPARLAVGIVGAGRVGSVLGSALQGVALLLFLPFDSLVSLYVIAGLFGLFQGGIVPSATSSRIALAHFRASA